MMKEKTAEQVWSGCLEIVKDNVSPQNFKTWFEPIKPIKINNNVSVSYTHLTLPTILRV